MQYLINNLEANVRERTEQLHRVNITLEENKNQLRLILDSAAEGIYGTDLDGNCTFCNTSCLKLLGYSRAEELLGKNVHYMFHNRHHDGTQFPIEDCKIFQSFRQSKGFKLIGRVFFRADGSSLPFGISFISQIKNGRCRAQSSLLRISRTQAKRRGDPYLGCHEYYGAYQQKCLEETLAKTKYSRNLPYPSFCGYQRTEDD